MSRYVFGGAWIPTEWQEEAFSQAIFLHPDTEERLLICDEVDSSDTPQDPYPAGEWRQVNDRLWVSSAPYMDQLNRKVYATMRLEVEGVEW